MVCQTKRHKGVEYRYYSCSKAFRFGRSFCDQPNLNADQLESVLWEFVSGRLKSHCKLSPHSPRSNCFTAKPEQQDDPGQLSRVRRELRKHQIALERLLLTSGLPASTFERLKDTYISAIARLEQEESSLLQPVDTTPSISFELEGWFAYAELQRRTSLVEARRLFHELVQTILVDGYDIQEIEFNYRF